MDQLPAWVQVIVPAASALLGALVGGWVTYTTTWRLERKRRESDERQVARALRGEIAALVELLKLREYAPYFREVAKAVRVVGAPIPTPVPVTREYFAVYEANVNKIGMLKGPLPEGTAALYTLGNAFLEDLAQLGGTEWSQREETLRQIGIPDHIAKQRIVEVCAALHEGAADLHDKLISDGSALVAQIDELYPATSERESLAGLFLDLLPSNRASKRLRRGLPTQGGASVERRGDTPED